MRIKQVLDELGIKAEIIGDPDVEFEKPATLWDGGPGTITFCTKAKVGDVSGAVCIARASVILVDRDVDLGSIRITGKAIVKVADPRKALVAILRHCFPQARLKQGIHPSAVVHEEASIHPTAHVGPKCVIGKATIGEGSAIHANVVINDGVAIGRNVIVFPGTVIGYDGFGYYTEKDGSLQNFPHHGSVIIEDDVEIGSNTSIDRGTLGDTIIKKGAKIDNLCHIAHNVMVGEGAMVIAHAMVGGSVKIGKGAWIAPNAIIRDGLIIGDKALVGLGAVVTKDVPPGVTVAGNPARIFEKKE